MTGQLNPTAAAPVVMIPYRVGVTPMAQAYYDAARVTFSSAATPNVMAVKCVVGGRCCRRVRI